MDDYIKVNGNEHFKIDRRSFQDCASLRIKVEIKIDQKSS